MVNRVQQPVKNKAKVKACFRFSLLEYLNCFKMNILTMFDKRILFIVAKKKPIEREKHIKRLRYCF